MAPLNAAVIEAVRGIREFAMREVMAMVNRLQPEPDSLDLGLTTAAEAGFRRGHLNARMRVYDEIERMIAREAPAATAQAGYTSDGIEDGC